MAYKPRARNQPNSYTCVSTCASQLTNHASIGRLAPDPNRIHTRSGNVFTAGRSYTAVADAVQTLYGVTLAPRYGASRGDLRALVAGGFMVAVSIDTSVTRYTARRTGTFVGGHSIEVAAEGYAWRTGGSCHCEANREGEHAEYLCEDPGTYSQGYVWWSADLLYRAAEKRGGGRINLLVGRDNEGVSRTARRKGAIRRNPNKDAAKVGSIVVGRAYTLRNTVNGGPWARADGTPADGWAEVGADRWTKGEVF